MTAAALGGASAKQSRADDICRRLPRRVSAAVVGRSRRLPRGPSEEARLRSGPRSALSPSRPPGGPVLVCLRPQVDAHGRVEVESVPQGPQYGFIRSAFMSPNSTGGLLLRYAGQRESHSPQPSGWGCGGDNERPDGEAARTPAGVEQLCVGARFLEPPRTGTVARVCSLHQVGAIAPGVPGSPRMLGCACSL